MVERLKDSGVNIFHGIGLALIAPLLTYSLMALLSEDIIEFVTSIPLWVPLLTGVLAFLSIPSFVVAHYMEFSR